MTDGRAIAYSALCIYTVCRRALKTAAEAYQQRTDY